MSAVAIAPTTNELEAVLVDEFRSYLHNDIVKAVFCFSSDPNFIEHAETLAAFLNVPVEEASNYLLPVCKSAVAAIEQFSNSALTTNLSNFPVPQNSSERAAHVGDAVQGTTPRVHEVQHGTA